MAHYMINSHLLNDNAYIQRLVCYLKFSELRLILDAVKQTKTGHKSMLCDRVISLLSEPSFNSTILKQQIVQAYNSRFKYNDPSQYDSDYSDTFQPWSGNFFQSNLNYPYVDISEHPPITSPNPAIEFKQLPFFKTMQTLLKPMYCNTSSNLADFTGLFYLEDNVRHLIVKSWNIGRQEYKIQIILRLAQVGLEESVTERLPRNLNISVNDRKCKIPALNISTKPGVYPWRNNMPIDITQQTNLKKCLQHKLQINWSEEPHQYMAGVFVAEKLTWEDLLEQLNKRPMCPSNKTKESIKKSMESETDVGVDSLYFTVKDPLSKTRMQLPARGMDCIHLQCFDVIQFLQINALKQTWMCPLCKIKVQFENIEVDEFFLNILKSPNLSEECESVILLADGTWSEKQNKEFENTFKTNDQPSTSNIKELLLSDSDDEDDDPPIKHSKYEQSLIKSDCIVNVDDQTKNDHKLDLSFKNRSPSTSSEYRPFMLNGNPYSTLSTNESPSLLKDLARTEVAGDNLDIKPCDSGNSETNKHLKKEKSQKVLCVITLD